jgi:type II secretion system protein H
VKRVQQRGFSLLELLVALFVIVLVTSLVSLSVGTGDQDILLESKVRNLADVAEYALDEAQMAGRSYGLVLERGLVEGEEVDSYRWLQWTPPDGWQDPPGDKEVFAAQDMPTQVELLLELEDVPGVDLSPRFGGEAGAASADPQVVFYASGETTAGAIDVRQRDSGELLWRVEWDLLGRIQVLRRGEAQDESLD